MEPDAVQRENKPLECRFILLGALGLGRYFNVPAQFWMNLQSYYDLEQESDKLGTRLETEIRSISVT